MSMYTNTSLSSLVSNSSQLPHSRNQVCGVGGGGTPSNRLIGMCHWVGSHFHGCIDYNGVAFSLELLKWDSTFLGFEGSESSGR